jgi:hypothetical protein
MPKFYLLPTSNTWGQLLYQLLLIGISSLLLVVMAWCFHLYNVASLIFDGGQLIISLIALRFILKPEKTKELIFQSLADRLLFLVILILLFLENGFTWYVFGFCEYDFLCDNLLPAIRPVIVPFIELLFGFDGIWLVLLALSYWRFISARQPVMRSLLLSLFISMAIAPSFFYFVLLVDRFVQHVEPFNHL